MDGFRGDKDQLLRTEEILEIEKNIFEDPSSRAVLQVIKRKRDDDEEDFELVCKIISLSF